MRVLSVQPCASGSLIHAMYDENDNIIVFERGGLALGYIEAKPIIHAHWIGIEYDGYADGFPVYNRWECSECRCEMPGEDIPNEMTYCPCCGSKMEE